MASCFSDVDDSVVAKANARTGTSSTKMLRRPMTKSVVAPTLQHLRFVVDTLTASPVLERLYSGCDICCSDVWGETRSSPLKKNTHKKLKNAFQPTCITRGTCTSLPSHPSPHCCSPSLMGERANAATVGVTVHKTLLRRRRCGSTLQLRLHTLMPGKKPHSQSQTAITGQSATSGTCSLNAPKFLSRNSQPATHSCQRNSTSNQK